MDSEMEVQICNFKITFKILLFTKNVGTSCYPFYNVLMYCTSNEMENILPNRLKWRYFIS